MRLFILSYLIFYLIGSEKPVACSTTGTSLPVCSGKSLFDSLYIYSLHVTCFAILTDKLATHQLTTKKGVIRPCLDCDTFVSNTFWLVGNNIGSG
jgi:hypothetical protein